MRCVARFRAFVLVVFLSCLVLACATSPSLPIQPQNTQPLLSKETDRDIVIMSGFGTNRASGSILGLKPMTFDELSNCGTKIKSIKEDHARFKVEDSELMRRQVELERQDRAFDIERPAINIKNAKQVANFNKRIEQNMAAISQFNFDVNRLKNEAATQNIRNNDFSTS